MKRAFERLVVAVGRGAMILLTGALIAFGVAVWRSSLVSPELTGTAVAWSTGIAAVLAAGAVLLLLRHRTHQMARRARGEHTWAEPGKAVAHPHPEAAPRHAWYRGKSHSGGRPRFD